MYYIFIHIIHNIFVPHSGLFKTTLWSAINTQPFHMDHLGEPSCRKYDKKKRLKGLRQVVMRFSLFLRWTGVQREGGIERILQEFWNYFAV